MRLVVLALVVMLPPATASAQRGVASELGDPSGEYEPEPIEDEAPTEGAAEEEDYELGSGELADRLRALDATYAALASGGGQNWFNIILNLAAGAAQMGIGIAFTQIPDEPVLTDQLAPYFITLGATMIVRTIVVDLIMRPDARATALTYQHMPSITRANRLERLRYGEQQLDALADWSFASRMVDAGTNVVGAAASLLAYFVPMDTLGRDFSEFDAFIFIGPAISVILAIVTLASPSEAEQRRDAYHRMRRTLSERRGQRDSGVYEETDVPPPPRSGLQLQVGGGVDPRGGGAFSVGATF